MKSAKERKIESENARKALISEEMQAIDQLMDYAVAKGETMINLNVYPSKGVVSILYAHGYHITDHSSQKDGVDIDISWD